MKNRLLPLFLILIVAVLFAPLCRGFVRELFVIPFLYIFWITKFLFETIPQASLWPFFVIILFFILVTSFVGKRKHTKKTGAPPPVNPGRVENWAGLIEQAENDEYYKWRLGQQLQKVAVQTIAHQKGQTIKQTREQLRRGEWDVPAEFLAYFQAGLQPLGHLSPHNRLPFLHSSPPSPLDIEPARIVAFLESLNHETNQDS